MAGVASLVAGDVDARLGAADGLPEIDIHDVFEVAALFGLGLFLAAPRPLKNWEKMSRKPPEPPLRCGGRRCPEAPGRAAEDIGEVETGEIHVGLGALGAVRAPGPSPAGTAQPFSE